ncbi:heterokaryon incompatibility protein-domain-containing protein, partial [Halenospora varia]
STIRLLEILPAATENESLFTRLSTADLDSTSLRYEALSYTWGVKSSIDKKHSIYVNGYRQSVTPNLHSALSSLRHHSRSRTLWVDTICINQADVQERCHQILLMARIYAGASKVLIYLGPST